jgi:tRNA threonylcarbamoyl adenosine modification protein YeaZ
MFLCIDTITAESGIALVQGGHPIGFEPLESRHSSDGLFVAIERLFERAKIAPSDLQGIAVIKGPGSFTSVRVGVAVANQFAHQLKIPIVGMTTDEWYRFKIDKKDFLYLQTMNRDELYGVGFGKYAKTLKNPIFPFIGLPQGKTIPWIGQLNENHLVPLPKGLKAIPKPKDVRDTWTAACESVFEASKKPKAYDLVDPYYGKEPHITPSKRHLKLGKLQ